MEPVPVAEKVLTTKLFGFSVRKLMQSFAVPVAPGLLLTVANAPPLVFAPVLLSGFIVGSAVYVKTPPGQDPVGWLSGYVALVIGPESFHWKPARFQDDDPEIRDGDRGSYAEPDPAETQTESAALGRQNTAENLDFQAVHDDGVLETEESFALMVEVEARPWLILDEQSRQAVYDAFSQFLMGLKSPIQIFTLPVPYQAEAYIDNLRDANVGRDEAESRRLEYGRVQHGEWLEDVVELGDIRDRRHFVVVTAKKHRQNEEEVDDGVLDRIKPAREDVDQDQRYDELWTRAENVSGSLPRTGVETEVIDDRDAALKVLYYYYRTAESPVDMDHGWLSRGASDDPASTDRQTVF